MSEDSQLFYSNPALWTILHPLQSCPWVDVESFGFAQPNVRKSGWSLVQTLLTLHKGSHGHLLTSIYNSDLRADHLETLVPTIGTAILRSAWIEMDSNVQGAMWEPLLVFLKRMLPLPFFWKRPVITSVFRIPSVLDTRRKSEGI